MAKGVAGQPTKDAWPGHQQGPPLFQHPVALPPFAEPRHCLTWGIIFESSHSKQIPLPLRAARIFRWISVCCVCCLVFDCETGSHSLACVHLTWNSVCSPGWPQDCSNPSASGTGYLSWLLHLSTAWKELKSSKSLIKVTGNLRSGSTALSQQRWELSESGYRCSRTDGRETLCQHKTTKPRTVMY